MILHTVNNEAHLPILRKKLAPFVFEDHAPKEIKKLVKDMRIKMHEERGVGLAANQVGLDMQVFVAETEGKFYAVFNPVIEKTFGKKKTFEEGCLSVPGKYGTTKRYEKILLTGQDQNGKDIKIKAWGHLAHIFQHETDHLNGIIYIDHALEVRDTPQTS